jgi:putative aldouronate transport system permease protein
MNFLSRLRTGKRVRNLSKYKCLLFMALPGIIYFLIFHYLPLWGILIAFKDFKPYLGFAKSQWVGLEHFHRLIQEPVFWRVLANSLIINLCNLIFFFPLPIILALLLNEVRSRFFKRTVQTVVYLPHFLSWVIVYGITFLLFSNQGLVNIQLREWNRQPVPVFFEASFFRPMIVLQQIWRDAGWGAIVILAALTGISPELYEAAMIDGANRWQQFRYITLSGIKGVILILLILRMGNLLRIGFEQIYIMQNPLNYRVSEVLETYSFRTGILNANFGYATAVGLFQSAVAVFLTVSANWVVNKMGEEGIW